MMLHEIAGATLHEIDCRISYTEGLHYSALWWQKHRFQTRDPRASASARDQRL